MAPIPGFELGEKVYESQRTVVYRARQLHTDRPTILKVLKSEEPRSEEFARYRREYEITSRLEREHVVRAFQFDVVQHRPVIAFEDIGAITLSQLMPSLRFQLCELLELAVAIADGICEIHAADVIHKDIHPSNIVLVPRTRRLQIIDFDIASILTRERARMVSPDVIEGTLAYVSPEQTGRMNRLIDCRTDYYSFGVTLYELLTGKVPFVGEDALSLVHQHLTRIPARLDELDPRIPAPVGAIVAKLLAKAPEERYQSAWGIKADLERCLDDLHAHDRVEPFPLGMHDVPRQLRISQKLYGRERELTQLLDAFEVARSGGRELVLVAGYSGIGKTRLVQELFKPLTAGRGLFVSGKFDQLRKNIPYSALAQGLQELVRQLLGESESSLKGWRERLAEALGPNGGVVADVIPEIELIIGPQRRVAELSPPEAQNRFHLTFKSFLRVFYRPEHPLVVFLDDLQWADGATLKLLEVLVNDDDTQHLLLVGSYRDNEVGAGHPLLATRNDLRKRGAPLREVSLAPLQVEHLAELIGDTLHCDANTAMPLASLVEHKTAGNPFFVGQFLDMLHQEGLLAFRGGAHGELPRWRWEMASIEQANITDNVAELMLGRLRSLPRRTVDALELAACLGNRFDLVTLGLIHQRSTAETDADLLPAVREGLIFPVSALSMPDHQDVAGPPVFAQYRFLHDRVQQASYSMIDAAKRPGLHLRIGRLLLAQSLAPNRPEMLFEIVDHLNAGRALVQRLDERLEIARLNLEAARKARRATAYGAALRFAKNGMDVFGGDWTDQYALTLALHNERAELEYLNGNHRRSREMLETILAHARDLDRAEAYAQLVTHQTVLGENEEAMDSAAKALAVLGIQFPTEEALQSALDAELEEVDRRLEGRSVRSLIDLPSMGDPRIVVAMKVLMTVHTAIYFANHYRLYCWVLARMTNLSMQFGNAPESAKGYASFGNTLAANLGRYEMGYEFGLLGLDLAGKYGDESLECKVCLILSMFLNHWVEHVVAADVFDERGRRAGMASGELQFVGYILFYGRTANRFHRGEELGQLLSDVREYLSFTRKNEQNVATDSLLGALLVMSNLVGATGDARSFDIEELTEADYLGTCRDNHSLSAICFYETAKALALYLHGDSTGALRSLEAAAPLLGVLKGVLTEAEHRFLHSLVLADISNGADAAERSVMRASMEKNQQSMRIWAEHCPANFLHQVLLIDAELARLDGDAGRAMTLYDRAISAAEAGGFVQNRAIGNELAGRFWMAQGKPEFARHYQRQAVLGFRAWGARHKHLALESSHPEVVAPRASSRTTSSALDLASVLKACQAISGEIVLDRLLDRLLRVVLESAGAQRGVVVLSRDGNARIVASITAGGEAPMLFDEPLEESTKLPVVLVQYVWRTHTPVVLRDAAREGMFTNAPYVRAARPRSVSGLPILHGGELTGVLYIENDRAAGVFSSDRVELLELLAAQAAIALQNAMLLERERAARTLAEDAEQRAAFLAKASKLLTESLDYEEVMRRLARLIVSELADWCVIDVKEGDRVRRLVGEHTDPAKHVLLEELCRKYPCKLESTAPAAEVMRTGEVLLLPELTDEILRTRCTNDEHAKLIVGLGTRSLVAVPLVLRGRMLGAITLGSASPEHRYGPAHLSLIREIADRAAIAIENAHLFQQTQRAVQLREEFLMVASHELRTPLTPIKIQNQILKRLVESIPKEALPKRDAVLAAAERSLDSIESLERLSRNLLDVSRIGAGTFRPQREELDLSRLVRDMLEGYAPMCKSLGCEVHLRADHPVQGSWDRAMLEQLVGNLVTNAMKFGAGKPIDIEVETTEGGGEAQLVVRDHGIGIAKEDQTRIGARFERACSARNYGGLGLGLYIVREVVLSHRGSVRVESEPGHGASFIVALPPQ
ncbi:Signal transduction histidine kinase CheA [Labilithrix luteola]|uniref:histidine kinase n=1 Tax=Labilithrix luteola TaxID=1391654 RepID=A0A0K1Q150_9BACT|nr:ATP-binding sensor histidine kinase [Labilithrix luteola]AKU99134.1 Signal transduction histidine kinase CheA [Labilithrix luteola]